ncbi:MAG: discoidin domain-containing protein [Isosphaeraceae bacterium]
MKRWFGLLLVLPCVLSWPVAPAGAQESPRPIRALLVLGGCCHDYARQKDILARGIARRAHVEVTIAYDPDKSTGHKNPVYDNPDWAKGFDVIIHDECSSGVTDKAVIDTILGPHRDGLPGVVLHCGMHCYRTEGFPRLATTWMKFTGLISTGHGPQQPIAVAYIDKTSPIVGPLGDWTTVNEELYNNAAGRLEPTAHALARGKQGRAESVVVWTNTYNGKTRVFSTSLGHNNATVADPRYLDLVTRGLLWAVDKLDDRYLKPATDLVPEDLAKGKPATASSTQSPDHSPGAAVDGNPETRWCADGPSSPQWWQVDLGKPEGLTGARILWEQDGVAYRYKVEGSEDGKSWTMLADQTKGDARDQDRTHEFLARAVRYVRVTATGLPNGAWASIFEVQVFGTNKVPAPAGTTKASARPLRRAGKDGLLGEIRAPAGFAVTMFAQPPDVSYPTCLAAAPTGEVFVGVDENGSLDAKPGRGRVVRCIDVDGDGKADRFNVFARMDSPRGVIYDDGTLYVLHPPDLTAYHDDNGDGVADRSETLVKGIGFNLKFRGADHTTNGIRLGIDGYIYVAVGDYGFIKAVGKDGASLQYRGGGVVRVRTDGNGLEVVSRGQRNIYDVAVDPYLNLFTRDNTNDGDGWDVRLSHVVPTGHLGYPSLFKNFAEEIVQPLADYGGGSPTGSLYLQEPGLPEPFGDTLYTCEWGREGIFRHPLEPKGAGFTAGQEPFVMLPRPTDMDVDGQSRIYISSWRGAVFTYAGPNAGYVIRVTDPTAVRPAFPNLKAATDEQLVEHLASPSQVLRLAAQRAILRRSNKPAIARGLEALARTDGPLAPRVAAIFTMELLLGRDAIAPLVKLAGDPKVREFALIALSDRKEDAARIPAGPFVAALSDANPRVRLRAVVGLGRLGKVEAAPAIVALTADGDPLVAHVAVKALVALDAVDACLAALAPSTPKLAPGAARALQAIYSPKAVDGLIARLENARDEPILRLAFKALCRLDHREADYKGDWWTTRPDTSGPYYKPVAWDQTRRIESALGDALKRADSQSAGEFLIELVRNKVELEGAAAIDIDLASLAPSARAAVIDILIVRPSLPPRAIPFLESVAVSEKESPALRAKVVKGLDRYHRRSATAVLAAIGHQDAPPPELLDLWRDYLRNGDHARRVGDFRKLAEDADPAQRELGYAVLLALDANPRAPARAKAEAGRAIESAWKTPKGAASLLRAIGRTDSVKYAFQVKNRLKDEDIEVKKAAAFAASRLELDREAGHGPTIAAIPFESVLARATKEKGDPKLGERLFQRQGCIACHTVAPGEAPKGPSLLGIATRYSRAEVTESILKPSAKIAQGFEPQKFATVDGRTYEGFVVRESGDEVELRDIQGSATILPKKDIEDRARGDVSIMPTGLADPLTIQDFASLLAYLESLKSK